MAEEFNYDEAAIRAYLSSRGFSLRRCLHLPGHFVISYKEHMKPTQYQPTLLLRNLLVRLVNESLVIVTHSMVTSPTATLDMDIGFVEPECYPHREIFSKFGEMHDVPVTIKVDGRLFLAIVTRAHQPTTSSTSFLMIRRPPRSTRKESSAASDVYKRQGRT